jgi:hypothetical protein
MVRATWNNFIYEGEYLKDTVNGYGRIIYDDGVVYEGYFKNG